MSWLRTSPLRHSFSRNRSRSIDASNTECDPKACYDSFCKHWQQIHEIIQRAEVSLIVISYSIDPKMRRANKFCTIVLLQTSNDTSHDDVLGVVNNLDHMVTLLLIELHNCNKVPPPASQAAPPSPCLEYLLSENLLDKLFEWSTTTERYATSKQKTIATNKLTVFSSRMHCWTRE